MSNVYYHATLEENAYSIVSDGEIKPSIEGIVYCCTSLEDSLKFVVLRAIKGQHIVIFKINVPEGVEVEETFDHSEQFFQCKSYGICSKVPLEWIDLEGTMQYTV